VEVGIERFTFEERPAAAEIGFQLHLPRYLARIGHDLGSLTEVGTAPEAEAQSRCAVRLKGFAAAGTVIVQDRSVPGAGGSEGEAPCAAEMGSSVGAEADRTELQPWPPSVIGFDGGGQDPGFAATGVVAGCQPPIEFAQCRSENDLGLHVDSLHEDVDDASWRQIVEVLI